jgi:hypothetical protein
MMMVVMLLGTYGIESLDFTEVREMAIKPFIIEEYEPTEAMIKHVVNKDDN